MRFTNESEYRAEAVYLANSLISQMWADKQSTLKTNYDSTVGGLKYATFATDAVFAMKGANLAPPVVLVNDVTLPAAVTKTSSVVSVQLSWTLPGDSTVHNYTTTGVIGQN
jgi:type IV pilus assembly protein PilV